MANKRIIKVTVFPSPGQSIPFVRERQGEECAECGERKPTNKILGRFLCQDCEEEALEELEEVEHGRK